MRKHFRILGMALLLAMGAQANNVQIGPVTILGTDTLQFTLSWENSWRVTNNPNNWDAVWVFVKRSDCASIQWHHANLSSVDADHSASTLLFVDAYTDKKGVMIYRSAPGFGNTGSVTIKLKLDAPPPGNYQYKVFGVEMVYVPQDPFFVGDSVSTFTFKKGLTAEPYLISSEAPIKLSTAATDLWYNYPLQNSFTLSASYPKGYNSFYCMKYEISQGQYAEFLNSIPQDAFNNRYNASYAGVSRYTVSGSWPAIIATAPDRACNYIGTEDLLAYLDWSALSPMTELEFEKSCRGPNSNAPVAGEFAWGGSAATDANTIVPGTDGQPNETVADIIATGTGLANYNNNGVMGPLRCGFAALSATTRFEAGAAYYGIMEMSGNIFEITYNVDSTTYGRSYDFIGNHGDGELTTTPGSGCANQGWPGESFGDLNAQAFSFAPKGGSWSSPDNFGQLRISDRTVHYYEFPVIILDGRGRSSTFGGRGVSRRQ